MNYRCVTVIFLVYSLYCSSSKIRGKRSGSRTRRIVNGLPLNNYHSPYTVTKYFVWISNAHSCTFYDSWSNFLRSVTLKTVEAAIGYQTCSDINPEDELCGGALLTPRIVQTACHCLARVAETDSGDLHRFIVDDAFSDKTLSFVGSTATEDMTKGYYSERFIIHQKCTQHAKSKYNLHDYGIIVLQTVVTVGPGFILSFVPVYKEEAMAYIYYKLISEETVCLFVGFGQFVDNVEVTTHPSVMHHSWGAIRSYSSCYQWTNKKVSGFNFTEDATWYCHTPLAGIHSRPQFGDSGGPVTCNNEYVGLNSWGYDNFLVGVSEGGGYAPMGTSRTNLSGASATIFVTWENAAEHRDDFIRETLKLVN